MKIASAFALIWHGIFRRNKNWYRIIKITCTSKTFNKYIIDNTKILLSGWSSCISETKSLRLFPFTMALLWNEPKYDKTYKITNALKAMDPWTLVVEFAF